MGDGCKQSRVLFHFSLGRVHNRRHKSKPSKGGSKVITATTKPVVKFADRDCNEPHDSFGKSASVADCSTAAYAFVASTKGAVNSVVMKMQPGNSHDATLPKGWWRWSLGDFSKVVSIYSLSLIHI